MAAASFLFLLLSLLQGVQTLDNGVARVPPLGWSSWNTFRLTVNDSIIRTSADAMVATGLKAAGYEYILIDDGWPLCDKKAVDGTCLVPAPRDAEGRIPVDPVKFPYGMADLADYVHSKGLKLGIYTAVATRTCGGYTGSLYHEAIDAATFGSWGMDFMKFDTCGTECGVHDGCMQNSTAAMRDGLNATGRPIVYYIDAGNPSSPPRLYNPNLYYVPIDNEVKVANTPSQLVWYWGPETCNMWKSWFDHEDVWISTMDNLHHMIRLEMYQQAGAFNTPDMLTVGQGMMDEAQYRSQFFLWAVLGSPLILGNDIRKMDNFTLGLITAPEILAINQDIDAVQGTLVHSLNGGEVWIKPLHNGTFAAVLFNSNEEIAIYISLYISQNEYNNGDFWPAVLPGCQIRDAYLQKDLGYYTDAYTALVPPTDAVILHLTPSPSPL